MDGIDVDAFRSIDRARVPVQRRAVDDEIDTEVDTDLDLGAPDPEPDEPVELIVGDGLSERERQVLAFERQWWRRAGAKEQAIRELFGISSTRYYQLLNGLLDNGAALAYDPVLVKRLRRLRASRTRARTAGRVA
jgi:hypothetical protein